MNMNKQDFNSFSRQTASALSKMYVEVYKKEVYMKPITENNRIIAIDMMRGFAIFGIFLVNMLSFHTPFIYIDPYTWWDSGIDRNLYTVIDIFVQASFYPLFALLFGYGVMILRERVMAKGLSFPIIAFRRFTFLLILGLLHALLIWHGDILVTYAVIGFIFLLFMKMSAKSLIITGIVMYVLPNILLSLLLLVAMMLEPGSGVTMFVNIESYIHTYQQGSFVEITEQRIEDWYFTNNFGTLPLLVITILPLFLIGAGVQKLKLFEHIELHQSIIKKAAVFTLIAGLAIKAIPYVWDENLAAQYIQDTFGGPLLAIGYSLSIATLATMNKLRKILEPLAYVGRLSISNYLLQSILSTLLFYGYGLGFYGKVSIIEGTVIVIIVFIFQIFLSKLWMKHYYYGPVEWLWRVFTYMKKPELKRK